MTQLMKVQGITPDSIAEELGILPGAEVISINGKRIKDLLDYHFHSESENIILLIRQNGELVEYDIEKDADESIGLEFSPMRIRRCANRCAFCFVDQLPPGMRKSLYLKDGDYRFSFSDGNFVTLTNVGFQGLKRIVEYRLSPIYISVHTTNPELRKKLLGLKKDDHILEKIAFLNEHSIEMHCQIVLCPGWNDKAELESTLKDLFTFRKSVKSVAVVPVGLTKYRQNLPDIPPVTPELAGEIIEKERTWFEIYKNQEGERFVYPADEFFLLAGEEIPEREYYGGFYQLENGVGLTRDFLDNFREQARDFPSSLPRHRSIALATGTLAASIMDRYVVPVLSRINNLRVKLIPVKNNFFGESVTVAGLLTGSDFSSALGKYTKFDEFFLPERSLNHEGVFLDDRTPEDLRKKLNVPVTFTDNFLRIIFGEEHQGTKRPAFHSG